MCEKKKAKIHLGNQLPPLWVLVTHLLPALWKHLQNPSERVNLMFGFKLEWATLVNIVRCDLYLC